MFLKSLNKFVGKFCRTRHNSALLRLFCYPYIEMKTPMCTFMKVWWRLVHLVVLTCEHESRSPHVVF